MQILGVLNLSGDSFSDGGLVRSAEDGITRGKALHADGAAVIDVGAVSSNPDGEGCTAAEEIDRLAPVVEGLKAAGVPVSIDSFALETQRWAASRVDWLNDIRGFPDPRLYPTLAKSTCRLVVMHQVQQGRADRRVTHVDTVLAGIDRFFEVRLKALCDAGIARERLVVDPGMGFFLGATPEPSVAVLNRIGHLKRTTGCEVCIGVSRKSFLGALLGGRAVHARGPSTLAAELVAARRGADWIRTHDVAALADGWGITRALGAAGVE